MNIFFVKGSGNIYVENLLDLANSEGSAVCIVSAKVKSFFYSKTYFYLISLLRLSPNLYKWNLKNGNSSLKS